MSRFLPLFIKFSIFLVFFSSCVPNKRLVYLQNITDSTRSLKFEQNLEYTIKPGDNLYIQILSAEKESSDFLNLISGANMNYDVSVYLNSYAVSYSGFIELPVIGKIMVKDKTTNQIKNEIHKLIIEKYLTQVTIVVRQVNLTLTILGEVNKPSEYKLYQDRINIFEAIAIAGDLTYYAQRDNILIMRKTDKGLTTKRISLLDDNIINSEYYYLKPGDIIYVQPLKGKNFLFVQFPYTLIFSIITTTLLILNFFN